MQINALTYLLTYHHQVAGRVYSIVLICFTNDWLQRYWVLTFSGPTWQWNT